MFTRKFNISITSILAAFSMLLVGQFANAEEAIIEKDLKPEQTVINEITTPNSELSVKLSVNKPQKTYSLGDSLGISVSTNKDAYVTVLNIGVDGTTTVLYPYLDGTDNLVKADKTVAISGEGTGVTIKFHAPAGTDLIKAFASTKKIPLLDPAEITSSNTKIGTTKSSARNLKPSIQQIIDENKNDIEWAIDTVAVRSVDGGVSTAPAAVVDAGQTVTVTKPFGLTLTTDKLIYAIGEPVKLTVTSKKDCKLKLYNIGTSGAVRLLFPNQMQKIDMIKADQPVSIPQDAKKTIIASVGPAGVESVLALCSTKDATVIGQEGDFINQLFPKIGEWNKLNDRDLAVIAAPATNTNAGETARAVAAILVR